MGASKTAKAWNGGKTGATRPGTVIPLLSVCSVAGCGDEATSREPREGFVRVEVPGSREPARWYCPDWCALRGQALAEIRALRGAA